MSSRPKIKIPLNYLSTFWGEAHVISIGVNPLPDIDPPSYYRCKIGEIWIGLYPKIPPAHPVNPLLPPFSALDSPLLPPPPNCLVALSPDYLVTFPHSFHSLPVRSVIRFKNEYFLGFPPVLKRPDPPHSTPDYRVTQSPIYPLFIRFFVPHSFQKRIFL